MRANGTNKPCSIFCRMVLVSLIFFLVNVLLPIIRIYRYTKCIFGHSPEILMASLTKVIDTGRECLIPTRLIRSST